MTFFDTHAHLNDEQFTGGPAEVIVRARQAGVEQMIAVGTSHDSSLACLAIAEKFSGVFAAVGIHPNSSADAAADDWSKIVSLSEHEKVVALGETGLDLHWDYAPLSLQQDFFDRHIRLSQQCGKPFIVHMRDCEREIVAMLEEARRRGPLRGVMHSFTGDAALAQECLELGLSISFAGMVTFKKSDALRETAAAIPADRLLIETDSPYLSPHPLRGKRPNEPARVVHTATCLAEVRKTELSALALQTTQNARRLFLGAVPK